MLMWVPVPDTVLERHLSMLHRFSSFQLIPSNHTYHWQQTLLDKIDSYKLPLKASAVGSLLFIMYVFLLLQSSTVLSQSLFPLLCWLYQLFIYTWTITFTSPSTTINWSTTPQLHTLMLSVYTLFITLDLLLTPPTLPYLSITLLFLQCITHIHLHYI